MEQKVLQLYLAGHIGFLQFVKYIKHKRNIGLQEAKTWAEVAVAKYALPSSVWVEQLDKLDFPLAYIATDEDRVKWIEKTESLILKFIETHAQSKDHFSPN